MRGRSVARSESDVIMTDLPPVGVEKLLEQESAQDLHDAKAIRLGQTKPKTVHPVRTRLAHPGWGVTTVWGWRCMGTLLDETSVIIRATQRAREVLRQRL
jgi:hypothetical protein